MCTHLNLLHFDYIYYPYNVWRTYKNKMPIYSHWSIQPYPQALYETGRIEFDFIQYALKFINKC